MTGNTLRKDMTPEQRRAAPLEPRLYVRLRYEQLAEARANRATWREIAAAMAAAPSATGSDTMADTKLCPEEWMRQPDVAEFIEYITRSEAAPGDEPVQTDPNGVWAHWQVALAYAQHLSPEFRAWCGEIVEAHVRKNGDSLGTVISRFLALR